MCFVALTLDLMQLFVPRWEELYVLQASKVLSRMLLWECKSRVVWGPNIRWWRIIFRMRYKMMKWWAIKQVFLSLRSRWMLRRQDECRWSNFINLKLKFLLASYLEVLMGLWSFLLFEDKIKTQETQMSMINSKNEISS